MCAVDPTTIAQQLAFGVLRQLWKHIYINSRKDRNVHPHFQGSCSFCLKYEQLFSRPSLINLFYSKRFTILGISGVPDRSNRTISVIDFAYRQLYLCFLHRNRQHFFSLPFFRRTKQNSVYSVPKCHDPI